MPNYEQGKGDRNKLNRFKRRGRNNNNIDNYSYAIPNNLTHGNQSCSGCGSSIINDDSVNFNITDCLNMCTHNGGTFMDRRCMSACTREILSQ